MGLRQREWAERKTAELRQQLGGICVDCGRKRDLEFDCIEPQGHSHHRIEWSWRISFYLRQLRLGNLTLRCKSCNAKKGNRKEVQIECPF